MKLLDFFTESKTAREETNEDGIYFKGHFAAVIDGATSKTQKTYAGQSGGRFAAKCITAALDRISPKTPPIDLIKEINAALRDEIENNNFEYGPSAVIVLYNDFRKELISYGDAPYSINGVKYQSKIESDVIASKRRAEFINKLLKSGVSVEEIQKNDKGREVITDYLRDAAKSCANVEAPYGYPVISGKNIVESFVRVHRIKEGSELILASDGYPELFGCLSEAEVYLKDAIKKDVLCIKELLGTKGVAFGNVSFDDRTYLRFTT